MKIDLHSEAGGRVLAAMAKLSQSSPVALLYEPEAIMHRCHLNCQEKVAACGGSVSSGWTVAARNGTNGLSPWIAAVSHSVWQSPDGSLIDITARWRRVGEYEALADDILAPVFDETGHLLFWPDDSALDRPPKYLPLSKNKRLVRWCQAKNAWNGESITTR